MPATMRQLVYPAYTTPENFLFRTAPKPVVSKPTEVVVKVFAASVNPVDVKRAAGMMKALTKDEFPSPIGYDMSGVVEDVGAGVTRFSYGDAVFARLPDKYRGTFQEFVVCDASDLSPKPASLSFEEAAALPLAGTTAMLGITRTVEERGGTEWLRGKTAFVTGGLSATGSAVCMLLKNVFGVSRVICTVSTKKVDLVDKILGEGVVDQIIDYQTADPTKVLAANSIDFFFDTVGYPLQFLHTMRSGGEIVSIASIPDAYRIRNEIPELSSLMYYILSLPGAIGRLRAWRYGVGYHAEFVASDTATLDRLAGYCSEGKLRPVVGRVADFKDRGAVLGLFEEVGKAKGYTGKMVATVARPSVFKKSEKTLLIASFYVPLLTAFSPVSTSVEAVTEIFSKLTVAPTPEERAPLASSFAEILSSPIEDHDVPTAVVDKLKAALGNKKDAVARQAALEAIAALAVKQFTPSIEPYIVSLIPSIIEKASDKVPTVKAIAEPTAIAVTKAINPNSVKFILPLISNVVSTTPKWQEKVAALDCIVALVDAAPGQVALRMPELIPLLSEAMWDTKADVKKAARAAMVKATETIQNKDIEKFIPQLIECIAKPSNVPETVHALGATTFVQEVTSGTLSIMVPLLSRGLAERDTTIKRKAAVIIDNMCKLVEDPQVVAPFLPKLMPGLKSNHDNIADPEARDVTLRGLTTLTRVGDVKDGKIPEVSTAGDVKVCFATLEKLLKDKKVDKKFSPILEYVAAIAGTFVDERNNEAVTWTETVTPYLTAFLHEDEAKTLVETFRKESIANIPGSAVEEEEEEEGEDLCNCEFSLAYGAKILLNRTALRLKRGRRYGLCGPNGSGKSTLMRAIANGQVEGFPTQEECKTVYVEHDIDGSHAETSVLEFVATDPLVVDSSEASVQQALKDVGFTDEMIAMPITSLSGGWKMKLALARAVLKKADILLLDEPTNHLDTVNVAWLENYLITCGITSIIVSHDSAFLDHVVEFIIHYERFKLKKYKGNLSEFVKKVPTAKSYYELGASEMEFRFPEPGFLEGVKTKQKAIVKVSNMTFQYPGTSKPQIRDITFQCSLSSRIAVIGPNGAGKSTLINVLTGELLPTLGEVYVHENCRIAYIKQHAFAHIDQHLDKTPSEYIQWRFQTGEDRETMDRANRIINEDDEQAMNHIYKIDGTPRRVVAVNSRRKFKNTYEYECSFVLGENIGQKNERWIPMMSADNSWIPRNELIQTHAKMVAEVDMKEALASGQFRPLTRKEIEAHCAMLGLEAELVSHSRIRGLSGGQKVKLVLAACTWQRPHLIVLDEPTNYLDRDSLGALSKALKAFEGGIVIITHSAEFTKDLTEEVWAVLDGRMTPSGHNWVQGQGAGPRLDSKDGEEEDKFDAMGNKIETVKKAKKLSAAELRKKKKERMLKKKKLGDAYVSSDDEF